MTTEKLSTPVQHEDADSDLAICQQELHRLRDAPNATPNYKDNAVLPNFLSRRAAPEVPSSSGGGKIRIVDNEEITLMQNL